MKMVMAIIKPFKLDDVREALGGLGYSADEVQRAIRSLPADGDSSELLRHALRFLAAG